MSSDIDTDVANAQCTKEILETDGQKRDLALAYLLTSVDANFKAMVCRVRFPHEALQLLRDTFQGVSEASIEARPTHFQAISTKKGEHAVEYSTRIVGLVGELQDAGHDVSKVENARYCAHCQKSLKPR